MVTFVDFRGAKGSVPMRGLRGAGQRRRVQRLLHIVHGDEEAGVRQ